MIELVPFFAKPIAGNSTQEIDTGQLEIRKDGKRIGWYRPGTPSALLIDRFKDFEEIATQIKALREDIRDVKQLPPAPEPVETARTDDLF